jgi:hypothetical protein
MHTPDATTEADAVPRALLDELEIERPRKSGSPGESDASLTDTLEDSLVQQAQATDDALRDWRTESVRRREAHDVLAAAAEHARRQRLKRNALVAGVVGAAGLGALVALLTVVALTTGMPDGPAEGQLVAASTEVAEVAPVVAPVPIAEPAAEVEPVAEVEPPAETEPTAVTSPPVRPADAAVAVVGDVRQWTEHDHEWIKFDVHHASPVYLQWVDGAGKLALDPMSCSGLSSSGMRTCHAGRSHTRLGIALEGGATAGEWTVRACDATACVDVGRFAVGG